VTAGDVELQLELIKQLGAILVALTILTGTVVTVLANRARTHAKAARYQVENDHKTNLRDEQDQRHRDNTSRLGILETRVGGMEKSLGRIEDHLGIERTIPTSRRKP